MQLSAVRVRETGPVCLRPHSHVIRQDKAMLRFKVNASRISFGIILCVAMRFLYFYDSLAWSSGRGNWGYGALNASTGPVNNQNAALLMNCSVNVPCEYPEEVDLRIIVLVYNRAKSLTKLLASLDNLIVDNDTAVMEIWIDVNTSGKVDNATLVVAESFRWKKGKKRVHVQPCHVGIYGQWIDTWRPRSHSKEIGLFFEDDLTVSLYAYRWLKAAHRFYDHLPYISGFTCQCHDIIISKAKKFTRMKLPVGGVSFLYALFNTWGFSPHPKQWRLFQDWFHTVITNKYFRPYVEGTIHTVWYKRFETKATTSKSMWSMFYTYFANQNQLFCVYSNLPSTNSCLAINRKEDGLHFKKNAHDISSRLLKNWSDKFVQFRRNDTILGLDGKRVV